MEKFEIFNSVDCYVCGEYMDLKCDLTIALGCSDKTIFQLIGKNSKKSFTS